MPRSGPLTFVEVPFQGYRSLRVTFNRWQDRYEHQIQLVTPVDATTILRSCEGGLPFWPASPPIQQLDRITSQGRTEAVLGLGMAGASHWSFSVSARGRRLLFDVACRLSEPPEDLGSEYTFVEAKLQALAEHMAVLVCGPDRVWLTLGTDQAKQPVGSTLITQANLRIVPAWVPRDSPSTVRWAYQLYGDGEAP